MKQSDDEIPSIDPELLEQVEAAEESDGDVQAVLFLDATSQDTKSRPPVDVETIVAQLIDRVEMETGEHPHDLNVFRNLGSFVVQASPAFLRRLIEQPEIRSARPNRRRS